MTSWVVHHFAVFSTLIFITSQTGNPPGWEYTAIAQGINGGIKCSGNFPDFAEYLLHPHYNPFLDTPANEQPYTNVVRLCARSDWGGSVLNAGAACPRLNADPTEITIDQRRPLVASSGNPDWRLSLFCFIKCTCIRGRNGAPLLQRAQGYNGIPQNGATFLFDRETNLISQILLTGRHSPAHFVPVEHLGDLPSGNSLAASLFRYTARFVGPAVRRIRCDGFVPDTSLLSAFTERHYSSLTEFCAANIYGGARKGSAGGYCPQNSANNFISFDDALADPFIARFRFILVYCQSRCYCARAAVSLAPIRFDESTGVVVDQSNPGRITFSADGSLDASSRTGNDLGASSSNARAARGGGRGRGRGRRREATLYVTPSTPGRVRLRLSRCAYFGEPDCEWLGLDKIFCPNGTCALASPTEEAAGTNLPSIISIDPIIDDLGPTGRGGLPGIAHISPFGQKMADTCSGECKGPEICGEECICAVDRGRNSVGPQGLPIFTGGKCQISVILGSSASGLGRKRDLFHDEEEPWCPCNSSYVSRKCCETRDGLVWEAPQMRLGTLA